jgi:putative ABC transport system permease protein
VGGAAAAIFIVILGAALSIPLLVILLRRLLVPVSERLLGMPGRLGLDYVQRTLGRSTINVLALMVAVSMSVSVGGWLASFEASLSGWFDGVNTADLNVTSGSPLVDRSHVPMKGELSARVARVPGVRAVQPYRIFEQEMGGLPLRIMATQSDTFLAEATRLGKGWPLIDGAPLEKGDLSEKGGILISDGAARRLKKKVGDELTFRTAKGEARFTVRGVVLDYASNTGSAFIDRDVFAARWGDDSIDAISVYIDAGALPDVVSEGIRKELGGTSIFVTTTSQVKDKILGAVKDAFSYSRSVEWITMLIALLGVAGTMLAAVIDRSREVATLRAIGASPGQVASAIVVEAGFLGFCAVIAGIFLGILECLLFLRMLVVADTGWQLDFVFPWASTARMGSLAMVTSMLAGGFAALRASRADVVGSVVYE